MLKDSMSGPVIYHILPVPVWEGLQGKAEYRAPSLESEGFIHASASLAQVLWVANRIYREEPRLVVLTMDRAQIKAPVKDEMARDGDGPFPHVYGPVNLEAVVEARDLARSEGRWVGWGEPAVDGALR